MHTLSARYATSTFNTLEEPSSGRATGPWEADAIPPAPAALSGVQNLVPFRRLRKNGETFRSDAASNRNATPAEIARVGDPAPDRQLPSGMHQRSAGVTSIGWGADGTNDQLIVKRLAMARQCGELELAFQAKVDLATRNYRGAETLLRWRNPTLGTVGPATFIPLAERFGLIVDIGAWVLETVVRRIAAHDVGRTSPFAVNVSVVQLQDERFVPWLVSLLSETGVCGTSLEIELTESALMSDVGTVARRLSRLKDHGVTITLDDFGTGYSALSQLRHLPVDVIKLAPEFVADMTTDPASDRLVGGLVGLAKQLHLKVVAEGIETEPQADRLLELGCDIGQGYLFARPVPFDQLMRLVVGGCAPRHSRQEI